MNQVQIAFDGESLITPELIAADGRAIDGHPQSEQFATARVQLGLVMNIARQRLEAGTAPAAAVGYLLETLHDMRRALDPAVWQELIPLAQDHPIAALIHQDPLTQRSFEKPRGYSGDAGLLDLIYRHPDAAETVAQSTALGQAIYDYTSHAPSCVAARERIEILARHVDAVTAARGGDSEILTIAAGHLREAELSSALRDGQIKRWVALDQDPLSVGLVARNHAGSCIEAMPGSVRGLLGNAYGIGTFDFIYAAGLYDYLPERVAVRLTQKCLEMLKPNGVFLFANFHVDMLDAAYMETLANWPLILRSENDVWNILRSSVDMNTVDAKVELGANRNMVYGIVTKRG